MSVGLVDQAGVGYVKIKLAGNLREGQTVAVLAPAMEAGLAQVERVEGFAQEMHFLVWLRGCFG